MKFNARNLMYCQFLNLRDSMFNHLDTQYLIYVKYIDIAFSQIKQADVRACNYLEKIIIDE